MNFTSTLLGDQMVYALGWTFIHSLWQGGMIALIMIVVLQRIPQRSPNARYSVAMASLVGVLFTTVATFLLLYLQPAKPEVAQAVMTAAAETSAPAQEQGFVLSAWIASRLPMLVSIWFAGVAILSFRLIFGLGYMERLRRSALTLDQNLQDAASKTCR